MGIGIRGSAATMPAKEVRREDGTDPAIASQIVETIPILRPKLFIALKGKRATIDPLDDC
jgi:hypothetical protein